MVLEGDLLWEPGADFKREANIAAYMNWLRETRGLEFDNYEALWQWSVDDIEAFWQSIWDFYAVESTTAYDCVLSDRSMPGAKWFPGARVNFAQHVLRATRPGDVAIHAVSELRPLQQMKFDDLEEQVRKLATRLRELGVKPGDRVAACLPAIPEAAVALLATTAVGAVWSCCSPDFGTSSVLDRFSQIDPILIFAVDGYRYGGRDFDRRDQMKQLIESLPSIEHVIGVPYLYPDETFAPVAGTLDWRSILEHGPIVSAVDFHFEDTAFDHPLWIVYSSGTTGLPKSFVHGHGGVLLEFLKFCALQLNLKPTSTTFLFSTTGWVTWNILVGSMMTGSSIVFYDGNPTAPDKEALWRIAEQTGTTFLGTSPAYVSLMMANGVVPAKHYDLSALEGVYCTGAPVSPEHFAWFYENVGEDLWVTSASGGTDVASAFVGGCPILPVRAGEIQTRFLGADVQSYNEEGEPVFDELGELVVRQPLPSMPLYLWKDDGGARYRESYFDTWPGVWRHGDYLMIKSGGGCYVRGRSDSTLNRHGVRIGTAEIYRTLEALDEISDSLIVNLDLPGGKSFMPLFVTLAAGCEMNDDLRDRINRALRSYSPRHVPEKIYEVQAIPYTLTGKKMEVPVRKILMGAEVKKAANLDAMADPSAIDYFVHFAGERRDY